MLTLQQAAGNAALAAMLVQRCGGDSSCGCGCAGTDEEPTKRPEAEIQRRPDSALGSLLHAVAQPQGSPGGERSGSSRGERAPDAGRVLGPRQPGVRDSRAPAARAPRRSTLPAQRAVTEMVALQQAAGNAAVAEMFVHRCGGDSSCGCGRSAADEDPTERFASVVQRRPDVEWPQSPPAVARCARCGASAAGPERSGDDALCTACGRAPARAGSREEAVATDGVQRSPSGTVQRSLADDALDIARRVLGSLKSRASSAMASLKSRAEGAVSGLKELASSISTALTTRGSAAMEALSAGWTALKRQATTLWNAIKAKGAALADSLSKAVDSVRQRLRNGWDAIKGQGRSLLEALKRLGAGLLDGTRGRLTAAFGGGCVGDESLGAAKAVLDTEATTGLASLTMDVSGLLGSLLKGAGTLASTARSNAAGIDTEGARSSAEVTRDGEAASSEIQTAGSTRERETGATVVGIQSDAQSGAARAQQQGQADVAGVRADGGAAVSGLHGLVGSLASALLGEANAVIAGVRDGASTLVSSLSAAASKTWGQLKELGTSLLRRLESAKSSFRSALRNLGDDLSKRARAAWEALGRAWQQAKQMAQGFVGKLMQGWNWLKDKAGSAWNALKRSLTGLRGRAASALNQAGGDMCEFDAAKQEAVELASSKPETPLASVLDADPIRLKARLGTLAPALRVDPRKVRTRLGRGAPLDDSVRSRMESAFGEDFSRIRLHTDPVAARLSSQLGARAFTVGEHVAFAQGEYRPSTPIGEALIAHELAHSVQQRSAGAQPMKAADGEDSAVELDADRSAIQAVARLWLGAKHGLDGTLESAVPRLRSGLALRRCSGIKDVTKCCDPLPDKGKLAAAEPPAFECNPNSGTFKDLGFVGRKRGILGLTRPSGAMQAQVNQWLNAVGNKPKVGKSSKCDEQCKPELPAPPTFGLVPFFSVKEGIHDDLSSSVRDDLKDKVTSGRCKGKRLPRKIGITADLADQARKAEIEHCQDFKRAWVLGMGRFIAAVQELQQGFCVEEGKDCVQEWNRLLELRTGIPPGNWTTIDQCLMDKTGVRDESGHTAPPGERQEASADCSQVVLVQTGSLPGLGSPKPEDLVKGCGE
jgi:hypothetical protein